MSTGHETLPVRKEFEGTIGFVGTDAMVSGTSLLHLSVTSKAAPLNAHSAPRRVARTPQTYSIPFPFPGGGCTHNGESLGHPTPPYKLSPLLLPGGPVPSDPTLTLGGQGSTPERQSNNNQGWPEAFPYSLLGQTLHFAPSHSSAWNPGRLPAAPAGPGTHALRLRAPPGSPKGRDQVRKEGRGTRRVRSRCAREVSHLRKRVHRPGLRVSIARRRFKFRKRKVSPDPVCPLEKTRSPGQGNSSQPARLFPAASTVDSDSGCRSNLNFSAGSRAQACGAGPGAPLPAPWVGHVASPGALVPGGAQPRPTAQAPGSGGRFPGTNRPRARSSTLRRLAHPAGFKPVPSRGLGLGVPHSSIPQCGIESPGVWNSPGPLASRGSLSAHPYVIQRGQQAWPS